MTIPMNIVFFEVEESDSDYLETKLPGHTLRFVPQRLTDENCDKFHDAEIIVVRSFSQSSGAILAKLPNLRLISARSTGVDHIDLEYCREKGIIVSNVPGYGEYTVAEHAIALMLAISRNIIPSVERTRKGDFTSSELRGFELHGKTLGVIGVGSIGRAVTRIAKAFGMHVIAYTRTPDPEQTEEYGFTYVSLENLLHNSDIISIHVPYNPSTHYLIGKDAIGKMKKGVVLINTARGAVVDTRALIDGLQNGTIGACGLDVLEHESELTENERTLLSMENVIVTPHNAFNSIESLQRILDTTIENIKAFADGSAQNVV